jgi:hypothetical protein
MLTPAQLATLKAAIDADPTLAAIPATPDGAYAIAEALDVAATPAFTVWKTAVEIDEIMRNGIDWSRVDNLTVGKARIWDWLSRLGSFNPSRANIRAGIDAAWVGTAADLAVRATVYTHCKRPATRAEKLYATGTGTDASPAVLTFEGKLQYTEVEAARRLT